MGVIPSASLLPMSTFAITFATGAFLGPGDTLTETDTEDVSYYCGRSCAADDLARLATEYPQGDKPTLDGAGIAHRDAAPQGAFVAVSSTPMISWGDMPCATSEVDYIVACEGCGAYMNATELESFDTGRRTVEDGLREVIRWAQDRGFDTDPEPVDDEGLSLLSDASDLDSVDEHGNLGHERLQWVFEAAEQYLNGLEGYRFEQNGDSGTTTLHARNADDPARVER